MNAQPIRTDLADLRRRRANLACVLRIQLAREPERRSYLLIRECLDACRAIDARLRAAGDNHERHI